MSVDNTSLPERFRACARQRADQHAIRFGERDVTFAELDAASDRVAAWLATRGVVKGDRVAHYCINSDAFATVYLGIVKAGAVVVPVNLLIGADEVRHVLTDAGVRGIFYYEAFAEKVGAFREGIEGLAFGVSIGPSPAPPGDTAWAEVLGSAGEPPGVHFDPAEDLAAILYTSGTTGYPKGRDAHPPQPGRQHRQRARGPGPGTGRGRAAGRPAHVSRLRRHRGHAVSPAARLHHRAPAEIRPAAGGGDHRRP